MTALTGFITVSEPNPPILALVPETLAALPAEVITTGSPLLIAPSATNVVVPAEATEAQLKALEPSVF